MDIATIIGLASSIGCVLFGIITGGAGLITFINIPSILITVGGTIAATLIAFPLPEFLKVFKVAMKILKSPQFDASVTIPLLVLYSEKSRQQGLLSLENEVENVKDDYLKTGMRLIIDGTAPEEIRDVLENEIDALAMRHKRAQDLFITIGKFAPAFGMIGTLIGLISMLRTMSDPSTIGPAMAVSLITTLYGSLMANILCLPVAGKLKTRTADELLMKRVILEGLIMIQAQANPRFIAQKLVAFLPPSMRTSALQKKKAVTESPGGIKNAQVQVQ
ncbi:MAG: motility protein A [bacterium]